MVHRAATLILTQGTKKIFLASNIDPTLQSLLIECMGSDTTWWTLSLGKRLFNQSIDRFISLYCRPRLARRRTLQSWTSKKRFGKRLTISMTSLGNRDFFNFIIGYTLKKVLCWISFKFLRFGSSHIRNFCVQLSKTFMESIQKEIYAQ